MTAYPLRYYFLAVMLMLSVYFLYLNTETGTIYFLFFLFSALTFNFLQSNFYKGIYLVLLFSGAVAYFARPLVLVNHPELFQYTKIAATTDIDTINEALRYALLNIVFLSIGFIVTVKSVPDKIISTVRPDNFMLRNFSIINIILIFLSSIRLALALYANVGIKGEASEDTSFAFMLRLSSPEMSFIIYYVYLSRYWARLTLQKRVIVLAMIGLTIFSVLITGSKAFLGIFGLCIFFSFIYRNRKIKLYTFSMFSIIGAVLIAFSFVIAAAVKFSGSNEPAAIIAKAQTIVTAGSILTISDDITKRMVGLDGQIGSYIIDEQANPKIKNALEESFSAKEVLLHTLNNVVPKVDFTNKPGSAKLASQYFDGFAVEKLHAGAIGLFAAIFFMAGPYFFLPLLIIGALIAAFFIYTRRIKNDDFRFILFFMGCYFTLRLVLSGNFDIILGEFVTQNILLFFYIKFISLIDIKHNIPVQRKMAGNVNPS